MALKVPHQCKGLHRNNVPFVLMARRMIAPGSNVASLCSLKLGMASKNAMLALMLGYDQLCRCNAGARPPVIRLLFVKIGTC